MTAFASVLLLGAAMGLRHALEPDHLAAVTAAVTRHPRSGRAMAMGLLWGLGHALSLLALGGGMLWLDLRLADWLAATIEAMVGLMVLAMGADLLLALRRERAHVHVHEHDGARHLHLHGHAHGAGHGHRHGGRRALLVGMAHGLAGSAGLVLLTATATRSPLEGVLFLLVYGLGAAVAMGLAAAGVALPLGWSDRRAGRVMLWLRAASGLSAVALGSIWSVGSARAAWLAW